MLLISRFRRHNFSFLVKDVALIQLYFFFMSQNTYISNDEPLKSYTDLNYIHLSKHETIWKNIVDSHPFNQAVNLNMPLCITWALINYILVNCILTNMFC